MEVCPCPRILGWVSGQGGQGRAGCWSTALPGRCPELMGGFLLAAR